MKLFFTIIFLMIQYICVTHGIITKVRKGTHGGNYRSNVSRLRPPVLTKNNSNSYHSLKPLTKNLTLESAIKKTPKRTATLNFNNNNNHNKNNVNIVRNTMLKDNIYSITSTAQKQQGCHDIEPKKKCLHLKNLGLCNKFGLNSRIRRCSETCNLCDQPPPPPACQEECPPTVCSGCLAAKPAPLPPSQPVIIEEITPPPILTTPRPCPVTCAIPAPTVAVTARPCPTACIRRRTTPFPIVVRRTTPHPVAVLVDNTPLPCVKAPSPTLQINRVLAAQINCGETVAVHRPTRPTLCPPLIHQFPNPIINAVAHRTTSFPLIYRTSSINLIQRRTTMLPLLHRHTTARPFVPTGRGPLFGGLGLNQINVARPLQTPYGKCNQAMDIGLAVDSSAAVVPHWNEMQNFLKSLVDRFQMNGLSRIGLIQFDSIAKMPVHLDSHCDPIALKQHIMKLVPDPYGRRRTDAALNMAKERLFAQGRSGIPKMLFVVEHGKINGGDPSIDWSQLLAEPAKRLKDSGVNVFAIGTTPIATVDELQTITSVSDPARVHPLQSYKQLQGIVPDIAKKACQIAGTTISTGINQKNDCSNSIYGCGLSCSDTKEQGMT